MSNEDYPLLSRVADSVYWLARYIERAENVARFIDVNLHLQLDLPFAPTNQWQPLIETTGDSERFMKKYVVASELNVIQFLAFDEENPNSIYSCLRFARENARSVREAALKGATWLIEKVETGEWKQPSPIGFYFAKLWYYERLYPMIFTVRALNLAARALR